LRVTIANNFVTVRRRLYVGEIFYADPCRTCPTHTLSEMSLRCRTFQKISPFLKFCSHTSAAELWRHTDVVTIGALQRIHALQRI